MKRKIINFEIQEKQRCILAYLESFPLARVLRNRKARLAASKIVCSSGLRELQSASREELSPALSYGDCRFAAFAIRVDADHAAFARGPHSVAG